jgi:hypothetical protein
MRLFWGALISVLVLLLAICIADFATYKRAKYTTKLTNFYYFATNTNYLEPTQSSKKLSIKPNSIYPNMPQINRLDYIYE